MELVRLHDQFSGNYWKDAKIVVGGSIVAGITCNSTIAKKASRYFYATVSTIS
eukprot:NODE_3863_length_375_cov_1.128834_g3291_i0.p2 GENE.NODE_3863_length_375_cov_1.128834_g3291_i0~~NODE_3863_length_375_cov_1.128834_g3291_i0.p2  ORF type:complete len:53 (+),score=1.51 NODE_3863_length_375_cov_1.128834_g3291_i0:138-296(+)